MTHIGSRRTMTTKCGKPVARRWWVNVTQWRKWRSGSDCPACVKAMKGRLW